MKIPSDIQKRVHDKLIEGTQLRNKEMKTSMGKLFYFTKGTTWLMDDFGNLVPVTFEMLGVASSYIHN